jgi:iron complex transport system substrate-binding protein
MKICSLVPGATEVVAALGHADQLVGISHECDYPPEVRHAPVMVESLVSGHNKPSDAVDAGVKALLRSGQRLYCLKEAAFVEAQPDLILAQDLCHVCAITPSQLLHAIESLPAFPQLLTLNPTNLEDILSDIDRIGAVLGATDQSRALASGLRNRLELVRQRAATIPVRPRVLCLEWLSPLYVGGHWVPEMVDHAGGIDVLGQTGKPSRTVPWADILAAEPEIVILMPCGFPIDRTIRELSTLARADAGWTRALSAWTRIYAVDAASYFSRPGPRLVDGIELLAKIIFPSEAMEFDERTVLPVSLRSLAANRS